MKRISCWFKGRPADSITPQEIERHFDQCVTEFDWAPSTVNHHRSLLSLAYQLGIRNRKVSTNPARATKHRKENNDRVRCLTSDEEARLRKVIESRFPHRMPELDLALHTGLRRSEMYGLDCEDVDIGRRYLHVRQGKNGEGRYVRLNAVAVKALQSLQAIGGNVGPVIRGRSGDALRGPRYWFEKAVAQAGIQDFHWHDLRHTFASRLAIAGAGIRAIQEALGHKSLAMTVRYSHLTPEFVQDAVDRLVPQTDEATIQERTDTTTDTSALESPEPHTKSVH
jgi:site-specific recombinase XerD